MTRTIDMTFIRYINLFEKMTRIRTQHCFNYNGHIIFLVPKQKVSKAIGAKGVNVKKISSVIGKKVKVLAMPKGVDDIKEFVVSLVSPVVFKSLEVEDDEIKISAATPSKAALIGRNKVKLGELKEIIKNYFNKDVKIV